MTVADLTKLDVILQKYEKEEQALIPVLQEAQEFYGYMPREVLIAIAKYLGVPVSRAYGVATFYKQFYFHPRGKNLITACQGTACHVRGGKFVLDAIKTNLGINEGETTPDNKFTLQTVACLGACALAPVIIINNVYYGKITMQKIKPLLAKF